MTTYLRHCNNCGYRGFITTEDFDDICDACGKKEHQTILKLPEAKEEEYTLNDCSS